MSNQDKKSALEAAVDVLSNMHKAEEARANKLEVLLANQQAKCKVLEAEIKRLGGLNDA